jgi:phosphate transport system substrate-binding protein
MKKYRIGMALSILILLSSLACKTAGGTTRNKIVITGSSTVAPLVAEIAKQFEAKHPDIRVDVQTGGSSRGLTDARQGLADIGMVSRALTDKETSSQYP